MRKRLRKKLRRAEFTELVFGLRYTLVAGLTAAAADDFLDRFLLQAVEANDLRCGGGGQGVAWDSSSRSRAGGAQAKLNV